MCLNKQIAVFFTFYYSTDDIIFQEVQVNLGGSVGFVGAKDLEELAKRILALESSLVVEEG